MTDFPSSAEHSRMRVCCLCFFASVVCAAQTTAPLTVAPWMGDRSAAISLTFDDAMATHLDYAGPILKRHGIHGTFFVSTGMEAWQKRIQQWQSLAAEGNEIGGHTVTHPCLLERIEPHAQDYTPQMM